MCVLKALGLGKTLWQIEHSCVFEAFFAGGEEVDARVDDEDGCDDIRVYGCEDDGSLLAYELG